MAALLPNAALDLDRDLAIGKRVIETPVARKVGIEALHGRRRRGIRIFVKVELDPIVVEPDFAEMLLEQDAEELGLNSIGLDVYSTRMSSAATAGILTTISFR